MWLERHGVDCSRDANEDDALVMALLVGLMACLGMLAFSAWWAGFIAAAIIFGLPVFLEKRKRRKST